MRVLLLAMARLSNFLRRHDADTVVEVAALGGVCSPAGQIRRDVNLVLIRHRARKMLIVCPASLQVQWYEQMREKFGLDFRIVDSTLMKELRRTRGIHVNPWNHFPRLITSIDFLKRERPLRLFREILPGPDTLIYPRKFTLHQITW